MKRSHRLIVNTLVVAGIAAVVLFCVILPWIDAAREGARRHACAKRLSSLGKACWMYAMDHEGVFPNRWADAENH